ncbi:hypothetical protein GGI15_000898 [Coemansia interrupta]|uniref:C3H1-type domain-containing protein n=1 Tax=Coemansia interrupta TaxID=1126814 RepID=A0A9W8LP50_9FUNG|nr:hypothetical protein GGI15_000898 [Coemansia interrupta]
MPVPALSMAIHQQASATSSDSATSKTAHRSQSGADQAQSDPSDSSREDEPKGASKSHRQTRSSAIRTPTEDTESIDDPNDPNQDRKGGGHNGGSTKHVPCKFYKLGNCTAGSKCFFSHDINLFVEKTTCKYYVKGNCRYGNKCALIHVGSNDASSRQQQKSSGNGSRSAHNAGSSSGALGSSKGGISRGAGGAFAASSKKERRGNSDLSYSDAASGRASTGAAQQTQSRHSSPSASSGTPASSTGTAGGAKQTSANTQSSKGLLSDRCLALGGDAAGNTLAGAREIPIKGAAGASHSGMGKTIASSWAPGSLASALRREQNQRGQTSNLGGYKEHPSLRADSGIHGQSAFRNSMIHQQDDDLSDYSLFAEHHNDSAGSPFGMHYSGIHGAGSTSAIDGELNPKSQPIPRPVPGAGWARRGGDTAMSYGGLSVQDSLRIDKLALSHSAAHQPFAGSPFLSSSIPLLDQYSDVPRNESAFGLGESPMASPFGRSPPASSSGSLLNRHAFSVVDPSNSDIETGRLPIGAGSSYHSHLHQHHPLGSSLRNVGDSGLSGRLDMSPSLNPMSSIGVGGHSIPRNTELFGRSLRSSSLINEPLSPLAAFATATEYVEGITPGAMLGVAPLGSPMSSNNNIGGGSGISAFGRQPMSGSHSMTNASVLSSGVDWGSIPGHPLMQESPFVVKDRQRFNNTIGGLSQQANSGVWDSYSSLLGSESASQEARRSPLGYSLGNGQHFMPAPSSYTQPSSSLNQLHSLGKPLRDDRWTRSPKAALHDHGLYGHASTNASHLSDQFQLPPLTSGPFSISNSGMDVGTIGQRDREGKLGMTADRHSGAGAIGQARSAFNGVNATISSLNIPGVGGSGNNNNGSSANVSSTASDNYGEMFELEQDTVPENSRSMRDAAMLKSGMTIDSFSQTQPGSSAQPISSVSAIARPAI